MHSSTRYLAALAIIAVLAAATPSSGETLLYEFTFNGSASGGACGYGSWSIAGTAQVEVEAQGQTVEARVLVNASRVDVDGDYRVWSCIQLFLAKEGFGDGFTYRFPVNASYPNAPLWHSPPGVEGNHTVEAPGRTGWIMYCGGRAVEGRIHFEGGSDLNASYTVAFNISTPTCTPNSSSVSGGSLPLWAPVIAAAAVAVAVMLVRGRGAGSGRP